MKSLILIRHSKSSWKDLSLTDFNRPLNSRGKSDGPLMADYLKSKINKIDYLHSSSSVRTFETSTRWRRGLSTGFTNKPLSRRC